MAAISIVHTEVHDETKPEGTRARSLGDDDIREYKRVIRERLAIDHQFQQDETGAISIGTHKKITLTEVQSSDPTAYTSVGYLYLKTVSSIAELFWKDESSNVTQITSAGFILGSSIKLPNNSNLLAKNAAGTGTVNLIKANGNDKVEIPDGALLATSAVPTVDAGIVNKKYVDDQDAATLAAVPAQVGLGAWDSKSVDTSYLAATDGFVVGYKGGNGVMYGYTDASNPPTTKRQGADPHDGYTMTTSICMPVKKGHYWKVTGTLVTLFWIPLG